MSDVCDHFDKIFTSQYHTFYFGKYYEKQRAYREANKETIKEKREANKEKMKQYYEDNKDKIKQKQQQQQRRDTLKTDSISAATDKSGSKWASVWSMIKRAVKVLMELSMAEVATGLAESKWAVKVRSGNASR